MRQPLISGTVTPPADLLEAARKMLGDKYDEFITEHGEDFTPKQLVDYAEVLRWHSD